MLTGEFRHSIDVKNRIFMPAKLREEMGEVFMVACDIRQKCLKVYSLEGWQAYIAPIKQQRRELAERIMRMLHSTASQVTPDAQGRILLPQFLIRDIGIDKACVIVGVSDHFEIWPAEAYDAFDDETDGNFEELAESLTEMLS